MFTDLANSDSGFVETPKVCMKRVTILDIKIKSCNIAFGYNISLRMSYVGTVASKKAPWGFGNFDN